ncbi:MAG: polysaccharide biosynthesis/export family protein [Gemmataceae bacterium]
MRTYALACPDRIRVQCDARPRLNGEYGIEADGCAALGELGRVRVDGTTVADVEQTLLRMTRLPPGQVQVSVTSFASRHLLMFGPAAGSQRVIPYQGGETVVELLQRTGGLAPGAAYNSMHVVRPHVADGRRPEVFPVDLQAIIERGNQQTNITLEPNDQIYLGETRGAIMARTLPPWVRAIWPGENCVDARGRPAENR